MSNCGEPLSKLTAKTVFIFNHYICQSCSASAEHITYEVNSSLLVCTLCCGISDYFTYHLYAFSVMQIGSLPMIQLCH